MPLINGSKQLCVRCGKTGRDVAKCLSLSTSVATSMSYLCETCMNEARKTWTEFLKSGKKQ